MTTVSTSAPAFNESETAAIAPYFTNLDGPVFALRHLPETVKGALFARYSRSPKSLRRLFLDEFLGDVNVNAAGAPATSEAGTVRADRLYQRVFNEYGDDSVAQLGGVHLAVEDASNILTKVLERGRLMAYLEQSTRYIPYTARRGDAWRYLVPAELDGLPIREQYVTVLNSAFETYARWIDPMRAWFEKRYPRTPTDSDAVYRSAIRAKALDTLRGLLPAATQSNVGIYGTGQAYEALLLRMRAHPLMEVRATAAEMLTELRKIIPAFLTRVDQPDRGGTWSRYLADIRARTAEVAARLDARTTGEPTTESEVTLSDFDPDGEIKVVAAALYAGSSLPDADLMACARRMTPAEREQVLRAAIGERSNRRHKPGRAFERTSYRFDILTDYGAFRDLQRHRLLSLEWQALSARHGYSQPEAVVQAGGDAEWREVMDRSAELYDALVDAGLPDAAQYVVSMAYRVRFVMDMNAREAMHVIELRTAPQGHPAYRRVCQQMHRLIADRAGHRAIAAAMSFADHSEVELERLQEERRLELKRTRQSGS
ncbi:MAG TPA: FAD-dependent thymidylate synthase [Vicinamibacterales bacterium]|nr:FAD-dependent thymidylate synthase [Vicinamibacterales bacterium]